MVFWSFRLLVRWRRYGGVGVREVNFGLLVVGFSTKELNLGGAAGAMMGFKAVL